MRTLTSKFCKSGSHPLTTFLFQNSKLLTTLLDSSMIHRLTNTSTQQFNDSHFLSCTSTLMRLQKEIFDSHSQKRVDPRQLKQFSPSAIHKTRRWSDPSPSPVLPLPNSSRLLLQQELHSTSDAAEKKLQSAKLPALQLPTSFLHTVRPPQEKPRPSYSPHPHRKLCPEASAILQYQTAILHNCIADPSHNSEPPHRLHTHSLQPPCKSLSTSHLSQINQASHSEVQ